MSSILGPGSRDSDSGTDSVKTEFTVLGKTKIQQETYQARDRWTSKIYYNRLNKIQVENTLTVLPEVRRPPGEGQRK